MKTEEQITTEIEGIMENQRQLKKQGRFDEAHDWNNVLYYLNWVLGKR